MSRGAHRGGNGALLRGDTGGGGIGRVAGAGSDQVVHAEAGCRPALSLRKRLRL